MSYLAIVQWCDQRKKMLIPLVLIVFSIPIWFSIGDHGFNGRSGARYAAVAQDMVRTGDWIVPRYLGEIHLTKPPLVYWLEAGSMSVLGHSYFAVRLPSALAGTLAIVLLFGFARKVASVRVAFFAAGLYSIMPMTIAPSRMTVTDSVVNLMWMSILFSGYLCAHFPDERRWRWTLWIAASLGMLAKGPVLFIPIGLVGVWWLISGFNLHKPTKVIWYFLFLILAMIPALGWAYGVYLSEPTALSIWRHETVDRAVGAGDHARPIWFFIPILFAGCFPASAMLILPGVNLRFKQAIMNLRDGQLAGFLGWSAIVPFVIFSLISGKLPSYLLPICSPMALLSALMLEHWFEQASPTPGEGRRLPEVRYGLLIGTVLYILGIGAVAWMGFGPMQSLWVIGLVPAGVVALVLVIRWKDYSFRAVGMGGFIGAWIVGWVVIEGLENVALEQMSIQPIIHQTFGPDGWTGRMGLYQFEDGMIYWDRNGELEHFETPESVLEAIQSNPSEPLLIVYEARVWVALEETNPQLYGLGKMRAQWHQLPVADARYLIVFNAQDAELIQE